MALPRFLYSITHTSREPLVARSKKGGSQADVEEELDLEQFTSPRHDTQGSFSGESTEIHSSHGSSATFASSVDTIGKGCKLKLLRLICDRRLANTPLHHRYYNIVSVIAPGAHRLHIAGRSVCDRQSSDLVGLIKGSK